MVGTHFTFDFILWGKRSNRVDDHHVNFSRPYERFDDFECLLASIGLGNEELVELYAKVLGILWIHGVLGVNECAYAAHFLCLSNRMERERCFS